MASVAPQFTVVVPSGKLAPDSGAHVVVMGDWPAVTVGAVYVTAWVAAATPVTDTSTGHAICGGFVAGLVGPVVTPGDVFEPQAAVTTNAAAAANRAVNLEPMSSIVPSGGGHVQAAPDVLPEGLRLTFHPQILEAEDAVAGGPNVQKGA